MIALSGIAGTACGDHVLPIVVTAPGERDQMIPRETLAMPQVRLTAVAILAAVPVSGKEERVGDLAAETAGNMDELDKAYDSWFREHQSFASDDVPVVRFDDLGFPLDDQTESTPYRNHSERFKGGVQRQTPHATSPDVVNGGHTMPPRRP
jgi:hypothetical protein